MARTYLVECYWPGITPAICAEAVARAGAAARAMRGEGSEIDLVDGLLVLADEMAFYRFAGRSVTDIEQVCARARIPFERICEYQEVTDC
jgi:hypothetical protein